MKQPLHKAEAAGTLLNPGSVGKLLGLSVGRLAQLDREGALPAMRDCVGRRYYRPEVVTDFSKRRDQARAQKRTPPHRAANGQFRAAGE